MFFSCIQFARCTPVCGSQWGTQSWVAFGKFDWCLKGRCYHCSLGGTAGMERARGMELPTLADRSSKKKKTLADRLFPAGKISQLQ